MTSEYFEVISIYYTQANLLMARLREPVHFDKTMSIASTLTPSEIAESAIGELGIESPEEIEHHRWVIMSAGDYVEEEFGPGNWSSFQAADYYRLHATATDHERIGIAIVLHGLFSILANYYGFVKPMDARRILKDVCAVAPTSPIIAGLHKTTIELLEAVQEELKQSVH